MPGIPTAAAITVAAAPAAALPIAETPVAAAPVTEAPAAEAPAAKPARRSRFDEIVLKHRRSIWSYILKLTGDRHTADDLCQEVFVRAFETHDTLLFEDRVRSWLFSIGYHVTVDWMRRRSAERRLKKALESKKAFEALPDSPERSAIRKEEAGLARLSVRALWRHVDGLTPIYRETVRLRYGNGFSLARIAARTGVPVGNVKVRLHRARKHLGRAMERDGLFLRSAV